MTEDRAAHALGKLLNVLKDRGYRFVVPTPETHALVSGRSAATDDILRDVFGWSRAFDPGQLEPELLDLLRASDEVEHLDGRLRSKVRIGEVDGRLFVHSAPSQAADAVFLGPDTYRYVRFLRQRIAPGSFSKALDIGVGAGVGAVTLKDRAPPADVSATDVNPKALAYAQINAAAADMEISLIEADGLPPGADQFDLIAANPPYIADEDGPTYRAGGGPLGADISLRWVRDGLRRLTPGGRLILYSGSAIVGGEDRLRDELVAIARAASARLDYEELDPDVFGETLSRPAYQQVERIAVIGAELTAP